MEEPLRVLHVVEASLGGVRRYLENIVEASDPQIIQGGLVYSTCRCDGQFWNLLGRCRSRGWELFEVPMVRSIHPWYDFRGWRDVWRAIRSFRPQIVHCHSSKAGALGRLAVHSLAPPRPQVCYSPNALAAHLGVHFKVIEQWLARRTALFVAISESEKREIMEVCQVPPERVVVAWPIIDVVHYAPTDQAEARCQIGLPVDYPVVVGLGRLSYQKDPLTFIKMVGWLKQERAELRALWVGDGELRPQFERMVEEEGLQETLSLTGWQEDVRPFIAAADVIVMPSRYESFGYVTAEALAMARPVVATRVTGTIDIIEDGNTGLLFEPEEWKAGAAAVARLLRSRAEAAALGAAGRDRVRRIFTPAAMRESLLKAYRAALFGLR